MTRSRIVVVEDERILALHLKLQLERLGYEVPVMAASGAKALRDIDASRPDLILMDIHIEGEIDGIETAAAIPPELGIPVVYVSAFSEEATLERARATAPYGYLVKPFSERELHATIQMALERHRAESALKVSQRDLAALADTLRGEVAERQRAEQTARQSEEQFRSIFAAVNDGIFIADAGSGQLVEVNRMGASMLGYEPEELMGMLIDAVFPGEASYSQAELAGWIEKATASGQPQRFDWHNRAKNGRLFWTEFSIRVTVIFGRKVVIATVRDMTERRAIEAELLQAQKMELIGQLSGGIAHDFNNLLGIIRGNLELLDDCLTGDPDCAAMASDAIDAADRAAVLTHQLLAYSRQQTLAPRTVNLRELVTNTVYLMRRTLDERIDIAITLPEELWRARIDPHQLENTLLNLAVNARDAMPSGGTLTIGGANRRLDEHHGKQHGDMTPGSYVQLTITDTGTGIAKDVLDRVLEPFFTTKPVGQGSGLGLSMVYGFVKQSGGHIKIDSEVGIGTTVNLYLPKAPEETDHAVHEREPADVPHALPGETILVVEDDEMMGKVTARILLGLGYRVLLCPHAPAALAMLDGDERIDLMLTDVVLPKGTSGPTLAREARTRRAGLTVLFMSGYTRDAFDAEAIDAADQMLVKPFAISELARKIREGLGG